MKTPPSTIDNARVLRVAELARAIRTGQTRHIVDGQPLDLERIAALVIAQYDHDEGVYLLYCDAEWQALTDTYHDSIDAAVLQAEFEFGPLEFLGGGHTP